MTKINIDTLKAQSASLKSTKLFALLAGIRGSGKSTVIGTLGVPTLLIASTLESHAIDASQLFGGDNIIPTLYDVEDETQVQLKSDAAISKLHSILDYFLSEESKISDIQAIALDSFSAVDKTLMTTARILQESNAFEVMKIMENEHLRIIKKLKELHRKGFHIIATMPILASFDDDGFYLSAKPELRGITTTSNIIGSFSEVLVVGRFGNDYAFQMDLLLKKAGKEVSGIDKIFVSHPRITGLSRQDLIEAGGEQLLLPADLSYVYQLKKSKRGE